MTHQLVDAADHVFTATVAAGRQVVVLVPMPPEAPIPQWAISLGVMGCIMALTVGIAIGLGAAAMTR